jgi:hypothetical protein
MVKIASSICCRSVRRSANILRISIIRSTSMTEVPFHNC